MKHRIISSSEIAKCRWNRLDPQHWIPEHKVEQCDLELAERLHHKRNEIDRKLRTQISALKRAAAGELAVYVDELRKGKTMSARYDSLSQLSKDEWQYILELLASGYEIEIEARWRNEGSRYVLTWEHHAPVYVLTDGKQVFAIREMSPTEALNAERTLLEWTNGKLYWLNKRLWEPETLAPETPEDNPRLNPSFGLTDEQIAKLEGK